jgi:FixJ family two-component response regulator
MNKQKQTVAIVDIDETNIETVKDLLLSSENFNVKIFLNPTELIKRNEIYEEADAFVVNVNLGNLDGRELYTIQKDRFKIIPFLFLIDRDITNSDFDISINEYDLFDYFRIPIRDNKKALLHKIKLMLSITSKYNNYSLKTLNNIREFWKETVKADAQMIRDLRVKTEEKNYGDLLKNGLVANT